MYLFSKQEELIMLSVFDLKDDATLSGIRRHLVQNAGKDWAMGSIYVALSRLIRNGFVRSYFGKPTPERGGKAQKYFSLTSEGIEQLKETKKLQDNIWKNFSNLIPE